MENWPKPKNYQEEVVALACAFFYDDDDDDTANVMCSSSIIKLESDQHTAFECIFSMSFGLAMTSSSANVNATPTNFFLLIFLEIIFL